METEFQALKNHEYAQSDVYLWVLKRSVAERMFNALHVQIDEALAEVFRSTVQAEVAGLVEHPPYSHLAQTNENSCLSINKDATNYLKLQAQVDRAETEHLIDDPAKIQGAIGYVVKYVCDDKTIYAIKKSTQSWKSHYPKKFVNIIFRAGELAAVEDASFAIERNFDFFSVDNAIFIKRKNAFESLLQHKAAYHDVFSNLQEDPVFSGLFTNMLPIIEHVGSNAIHLRRMATVHQKAIFAEPAFLSTLKTVNDHRQWGLNFDDESGQLVPCEETAKTIMQVLLDHRLLSELTHLIYDVPDATQV